MRKKTIKHTNMLRPRPATSNPEYSRLVFVCRGCTMNESRRFVWEGFVGSMADDPINRNIDNSYLTLEEEPGNIHDPNAIQVVCRGEHFGTMGYVGREFTKQVKEILNECQSYRVDIVDWNQGGQKEVQLVLTWKP